MCYIIVPFYMCVCSFALSFSFTLISTLYVSYIIYYYRFISMLSISFYFLVERKRNGQSKATALHVTIIHALQYACEYPPSSASTSCAPPLFYLCYQPAKLQGSVQELGFHTAPCPCQAIENACTCLCVLGNLRASPNPFSTCVARV